MNLRKGTLPLERREARIRIKETVSYCEGRPNHDIFEAVRIFTDRMMREGCLVELWHIEEIAGAYGRKEAAENIFKSFGEDHLCFRLTDPTPCYMMTTVQRRAAGHR